MSINDRTLVGILVIGGGVLVAAIMLSMGMTPNTTLPIYFVNYTSNGSYTCMDYILANVTINTTTITNPTLVNITLYNSSGSLNASFANTSALINDNLFTNFTNLSYGNYLLNATVANGSQTNVTPTLNITLSQCNYTITYNLGYPFKILCVNTTFNTYIQPQNQNDTNPIFTINNSEPFNLTYDMKLKNALNSNISIWVNSSANSTLKNLTTSYIELWNNVSNASTLDLWFWTNCTGNIAQTNMPNITFGVTRNA